MWLSETEWNDAWSRLVADPDTAGEFAAQMLPPLEADLTRQFPKVDPHDITSAIDTAMLAFLRKPSCFDPTRGTLPGFLRLAARRDLFNLLKAEKRHHKARIPWDGVELAQPARNEEMEGESLTDSPALRFAIDELSARDRGVLDLMRDGERSTAAFAAVMEIAHLTGVEQADEVKRAKDRIVARLKRAGRGP